MGFSWISNVSVLTYSQEDLSPVLSSFLWLSRSYLDGVLTSIR